MKKIVLFSILGILLVNLTGCFNYMRLAEMNTMGILPNNYSNQGSNIQIENTNIIQDTDTELEEVAPQPIGKPIMTYTDIQYLNWQEHTGQMRVIEVNAEDCQDGEQVYSFITKVFGEIIDLETGSSLYVNAPYTEFVNEGDVVDVVFDFYDDNTYKYIKNVRPNTYSREAVVVDTMVDVYDAEIEQPTEMFIEQDIKQDLEPITETSEQVEVIEDDNDDAAIEEVSNNTYMVTEGVNVRSKASKDSNLLGKLEAGEYIEVIELSKNGSWAHFIFNGQDAWTSTKYIRKVN